MFVTYCSADKREEAGRLPAITRYKSERIRRVAQSAQLLGLPFRILSGRYGLISAEEPIPHYDHLLAEAEVGDHASRVAQDLRSAGVGQVVFYSRPAGEDRNLGPYWRVMELACSEAGAELMIVEIEAAE